MFTTNRSYVNQLTIASEGLKKTTEYIYTVSVCKLYLTYLGINKLLNHIVVLYIAFNY